MEELDPRVAGRAALVVEAGVEDEQRENPVGLGDGRRERGVVRGPEVVAVPDDGVPFVAERRRTG